MSDMTTQRDQDYMLFQERDMPRAVVLHPRHIHYYKPDVAASGAGPAVYRCTNRNPVRDGVCDAPTEFRAMPGWWVAAERVEQDVWL